MTKKNTRHTHLPSSGGYPCSLREAVLQLVLILDADDLERLAGMGENEAGSLHFGLGLWIRNNFGLWSEGSQLMKDLDCLHADEASSRVIDALLAHVKTNPIPERLKALAQAALTTSVDSDPKPSDSTRKPS